jgi:uncharacterized protein (UPF0548 family)
VTLMFLMHQPSEQKIESFISAQRGKPLSYGPGGITRDPPPSGYNVDRNRLLLGSGLRTYRAAVAAIRNWKMFDIGWVRLFRDDTPIEAGSTVAVVVRHLGFWSMNACRIVYVIEESDPLERYGFAYGTLPEHAERGEERFTVEWSRQDDAVWYDILAVSKPGRLAGLGYPYARRLQRRFADGSKEAMMRAVAEAGV